METSIVHLEDDDPPYDPAFVEMIKQGDEDKAGKGVTIDVDDLWK
jgi:hypothetical protein